MKFIFFYIYKILFFHFQFFMKPTLLFSRSQKSTLGFVIILVFLSQSGIVYIVKILINENIKLLVKKFHSYFTVYKIWYSIFLLIVTFFILFLQLFYPDVVANYSSIIFMYFSNLLQSVVNNISDICLNFTQLRWIKFISLCVYYISIFPFVFIFLSLWNILPLSIKYKLMVFLKENYFYFILPTLHKLCNPIYYDNIYSFALLFLWIIEIVLVSIQVVLSTMFNFPLISMIIMQGSKNYQFKWSYLIDGCHEKFLLHKKKIDSCPTNVEKVAYVCKIVIALFVLVKLSKRISTKYLKPVV